MSQTRTRSTVRRCAAAVGAFLMCSLIGCASMRDDDNPVLTHRTGDRAKIVIDERPFSAAGGTYGITVTGPDGQPQTTTVEVFGYSWNPAHAADLERYFTEAMVESGAFVVIDRSVLDDKRVDAVNASLLEGDTQDRKVLRPDLKLKCTLTELNPDAEVKRSNFAAAAWYWLARRFAYGYYGWFGGGVEKMSRMARCQISVAIIDCRTGETLTTAKSEGFSVGTSTRVRTGGWGLGGGLSFGGGSSKDANLTLAIERATIRAVNAVIEKVPPQFFVHARDPGPIGAPVVGG